VVRSIPHLQPREGLRQLSPYRSRGQGLAVRNPADVINAATFLVHAADTDHRTREHLLTPEHNWLLTQQSEYTLSGCSVLPFS
jgi:hypothetical protein